MKRNLLWCALSGAAAGLVLGAVDALRLAFFERRMFFDILELLASMLWSIGVCGGAGALCGALGGALIMAVLAAEHRFLQGGEHRHFSWPFAVILFPVIAWLLWKLSAGPQASASAWRLWFVLALAGLSAMAAPLLVVRLAAFGRVSKNRRRFLLAAGAALSLVLVAVDSLVLVRLYPLFHWGLSMVALLVVALPLRALWARPLSFRDACVALVAVMGFSAWSLWAIRGSQNPRYIIGDRTASSADVLELSTYLVPLSVDNRLDMEPLPVADARRSADSVLTLPVLPGASLFLITIDAMRADRLALGGDSRHLMPNLERFARSSVVFTRAYTPYPHTSYAISSLLTGKYIHSLSEVPGAPAVHETWPQILTRFRYKTAGFFTKAIFFIDRARFEPYARSSYGFSYRKADYLVPATERVAQVLEFLDQMKKESPQSPLFVWTHFFEAHEPYDPECLKFGEAPVDRYDCELAKVDEALGTLLTRLEQNHPKAVIIVTADHGEEFGDHGGHYHGTTLYDEQAGVPLVVHVPGVAHRIVTEPVSLVDLLGTSLALLDVPVPARVRSRDLRSLLVGSQDSATYMAFAEAGDDAMLVAQNHKLVCNEATDLCRLYDLAKDAGESRSVAEAKPALVRDLKTQLFAMRRSHADAELRPISTDKGQVGWPESIRRAMAGDRRARDTLPQVIASAGSPPPVRRKAAELLRASWQGRPAGELPNPQAEADPEVATWLWLARLEAGEATASKPLFVAAKQLERSSRARQDAALLLLRSGHPSGIAEVLALVQDSNVPSEQRAAGLSLLADRSYAELAPDIIPLVDEYQLTLAAAEVLGSYRSVLAVPALLARLAKERFPERKAVIVRALAAIGDRRAVPLVVEQLFEPVPAPGLLEALCRLARVPARGRTFNVPGKGAVFVATKPASTALLRAPGRGLPRVVVRAKAVEEAGMLSVDCGDRAIQLPLGSEADEGFVDLAICGAFPGRQRVQLSSLPGDRPAEILAVAIVSVAPEVAPPRDTGQSH